MEFDKLLIGMFIFAFFVGGGLILLQDAVEQKNIITETDNSSGILTRISQNMSDTYLVASEWKSDLEGSPVTIDTAENNLFRNAFLAVKKIGNTADVIGAIFKELETYLGVPPLVQALFTGILLVAIVTTLLFLMFRFQPRR